MPVHECIIEPDGTMKFIYDDRFQPLIEEASEHVTCRVSHVEPTADGSWVADLSPINGPTSQPFKLRQDALDWEVAWLKQHYL